MAPARRPAAWRQDYGNAARKSAGKGAGRCSIPDLARYETESSPGRRVVRRRNEGIPGRDPWVTGGYWPVGLGADRCWSVRVLPVWGVGGRVVLIVRTAVMVTSLGYRCPLTDAIGAMTVANVVGVDAGRLGMPTAFHTQEGLQFGIDRLGRGSEHGVVVVVGSPVGRRRTWLAEARLVGRWDEQLVCPY